MAAGKIPQPVNKLPMARSRTNSRQSGVDTPAVGCMRQIRGCIRYASQTHNCERRKTERVQLFPRLFA